MANCILCGQKVGLLDRKNFMFHGTVQTLCIGCTARLDSAAPQEREELFRQMLDSPDLEDGERIRADLNTGRHCPACGGMLERRLRNFSIGADGYGGLTSLGLEQFEVDLYVCAKCRRVELYAAEHEVPLRTEQNDQVTCPVCGTRHSALCGCPTCAVQAAYVPAPPGLSRSRARSPSTRRNRKSIPFPGRKRRSPGRSERFPGRFERFCSDRAKEKAVIDRESRTQSVRSSPRNRWETRYIWCWRRGTWSAPPSERRDSLFM
ncbi:MAG: hypothetical protein ACLT3D_01220 [Lawsonibacter sp.]